MNKGKASLNYSFGDIEIEISVDGGDEQSQQVVDHMLSAATAILGAEALHLGIGQNQAQAQHRTEDDSTSQECETTVQFGQLKVTTKITFDLRQRISKRTINDVVFSDALPVILQAAGLYFGTRVGDSTSQAPLTSKERSRIIQHLEAAFKLDSSSASRRDSRGKQSRRSAAMAGSRD